MVEQRGFPGVGGPQHELLFVSSEEGAGLLEREFRVERFENPGTRYRNQRLDTPATVKLALKTLAKRGTELARLQALIEDFRPDRAISDYEYFVPIAADRAGIPCLSIDHQHVISCCHHTVPPRYWADYWGIKASIRFLFSACSDYLAISFFRPPVKPGARARVAPPILRHSVLERRPCRGEHIVVYQSCGICDAFAPYLRKIDREFRIYGYKIDKVDGNLTFRGYSEEGFLDDLASCAYVICGGSHNLMPRAGSPTSCCVRGTSGAPGKCRCRPDWWTATRTGRCCWPWTRRPSAPCPTCTRAPRREGR